MPTSDALVIAALIAAPAAAQSSPAQAWLQNWQARHVGMSQYRAPSGNTAGLPVSRIPRLVVVTVGSVAEVLAASRWRQNFETFWTLSPEYAHMLLEDADCESFLAACCPPEELLAFRLVKSGTQKNNMFLISWLREIGGIKGRVPRGAYQGALTKGRLPRGAYQGALTKGRLPRVPYQGGVPRWRRVAYQGSLTKGRLPRWRTKVAYQGWLTKGAYQDGRLPTVAYQGWHTKGRLPTVAYQGSLTKGSVARVLTKGSLPRVLTKGAYQGRLPRVLTKGAYQG
jgi:hypothetical protein